MRNIAIIPARGGSKRIPRKNIKAFCGKPIIAYSIEAALKSDLFDEVMVSTDDEEIAEVAIKYGAKVPFFRSSDNSNDYATLVDVLLEVINQYGVAGIEIENICCILPTAPLISSKRIVESFDLMDDKKYASIFPVLEYSYPIQRSLIKNSDGLIRMAWPENSSVRSQDLEKHYHDSGQFYWIKQKSLISEKTVFTTNTGVVELSQLEVQDIDTLDDWKMAEIKYQIINAS